MKLEGSSSFRIPGIVSSSRAYHTVKRTPMAVTKLAGLFPKPNAFDTIMDTKYETAVCTMKIIGITASSRSLSAVNCDANLVKTTDN